MSLRITGGFLKGKQLQLLRSNEHIEGFRPTQALLRQSVFNQYQGMFEGVALLDLYAGSGAIGFEALSRGAQKVVFVESNNRLRQLLIKNSQSFGVEKQVEVNVGPVANFLKQNRALFDFVYADPPYGTDGIDELLQLDWERVLKPGGVALFECRKRPQKSPLPDRVNHLIKVRERRYGDTLLVNYQLEGV